MGVLFIFYLYKFITNIIIDLFFACSFSAPLSCHRLWAYSFCVQSRMWIVSRNISILLDFHPRNFPRGLKTNVSCPQINVQHGPSVSVCRQPKMWNLGLSAQQTKLDTMSKDACVIFHILGPMLLSSCTSVLFFIHKVLSGDSHSAFRSYFDLEGFLDFCCFYHWTFLLSSNSLIPRRATGSSSLNGSSHKVCHWSISWLQFTSKLHCCHNWFRRSDNIARQLWFLFTITD